MKAVLMSIKPRWCELLASGKKTVEERKTKPKLEVPFKVYVYETKDKRYENIGICGWKEDGTAYIFKHHCGKVIGEFVCDKITFFGNVSTDKWDYLTGNVHEYHKKIVAEKACLTEKESLEYGGKFGWHITDLVIYDEPRELWEFYTLKKCHSCDSGYESTACIYDEDCRVPKAITRPFQSWGYVEEVEEDKYGKP